ncbi:30S ribosomal protein S16 [bacterium]|nr:30S ribosomal protein S16 [bacterium]
MAVALRLTRMGRKKRPYYRIIAIDSRRSRDGAYIERLGYYHPLDDPPAVNIDAEKALKWLRVGAQPSETVRSLLKQDGIWLRFRLEKRGMPEEQINETMTKWYSEKSASAKTKPAEKKEVEATPAETPVKEAEKSDQPEISEVVEAKEKPVEKETVETAPAEALVKEAEESDQPEISEVAKAKEKPVEKETLETASVEAPVKEAEETGKSDTLENSEAENAEVKADNTESSDKDMKASSSHDSGETTEQSETTEEIDASNDSEKETEESKE